MFDINKPIKSIEEVDEFFKFLTIDEKIIFHPDDPFEEIVDEKGESCFSSEKASIYNMRMNECFDVCEATNTDIYEIGFAYCRKFFESFRLNAQ